MYFASVAAAVVAVAATDAKQRRNGCVVMIVRQ